MEPIIMMEWIKLPNGLHVPVDSLIAVEYNPAIHLNIILMLETRQEHIGSIPISKDNTQMVFALPSSSLTPSRPMIMTTNVSCLFRIG